MPTTLGSNFYLREIGVHTPISLVRSKAEESPQTTIEKSEFIDLDSMAEQAKKCASCQLSQSRSQVLFGSGHKQADLLFIGGAPDEEEDKHGQSYLGDVGILFDAALASIGLSREQVYRLNIVQCCPPNHRDPTTEELAACQTWVNLQLAYVKPKVVCVLGRMAAQAITHQNDTLNSLRQGWHTYQGIPTLVSFHPAYLLRSPKQKQKAWEDFMLLKQHLS